MYIQEKEIPNHKPIYQQICCIIFRESSSGPVFGNEIEKKHFLDILLNAIKNKSVRVYAYCVLDETGYILMSAKTEQIMSEIMDRVREDFAVYYKKRFPGSSAAFEYEFQWLELCKSEQLIQACIELHLLPVRHGYAKQEQDYWWSSLKEYMLKYRSGIIYPEILLKRLDLNARGAVRKMKTLHRKRGYPGMPKQLPYNTNVSEKKK